MPKKLFPPGTSGNPRGRPTDHARAAVLRKQILKAAPDLVSAMIAAAKGGDTQAGRALLVCAVPPLKAAELNVTLPIDGDAGLADQGKSIIAALAGGILSPSQASQILTALGGLAKLVELSEFERRLAALEGAEPSPGPEYRPHVVYVEEPLPE